MTAIPKEYERETIYTSKFNLNRNLEAEKNMKKNSLSIMSISKRCQSNK